MENQDSQQVQAKKVWNLNKKICKCVSCKEYSLLSLNQLHGASFQTFFIHVTCSRWWCIDYPDSISFSLEYQAHTTSARFWEASHQQKNPVMIKEKSLGQRRQELKRETLLKKWFIQILQHSWRLVYDIFWVLYSWGFWNIMEMYLTIKYEEFSSQCSNDLKFEFGKCLRWILHPNTDSHSHKAADRVGHSRTDRPVHHTLTLQEFMCFGL